MHLPSNNWILLKGLPLHPAATDSREGEIRQETIRTSRKEMIRSLLLDEVSTDPERLARFDREARVLIKGWLDVGGDTQERIERWSPQQKS